MRREPMQPTSLTKDKLPNWGEFQFDPRDTRMSEASSPILLSLYNGVIAFDTWLEIDDGVECGVAARCQDGSDCFFVVLANPTYADCYGIANYQNIPFAALKQVTLEACGLHDDAQYPWCDYDDEGNVVIDTDTPDRLRSWLGSHVGNTDWDFDLLGQWLDPTSIYEPGKKIESALNEQEKKELGITWEWLGSPASSFLVVRTAADIEMLNKTMREKQLPYKFINVYHYLPDGR